MQPTPRPSAKSTVTPCPIGRARPSRSTSTPAIDNPNTGKKGPGLRVREPDPPETAQAETAQAETAQAASMEQVREIDLLGRLLYPGQTDDDITPWAAKREEMILHFTGEDGVHLTDLSDLQADQLLAGFRSRYDADQAANAAPPPPIAVTLDLIPPVEEPVPDFMPPVKESAQNGHREMEVPPF